ncbi:MAG: nucleotidyltransferase family protein [Kiritimatiellia bacterium]
MTDFLPWARQAFRALHGLPDAGNAVLPPEARHRLAAWARRHRLTGLLQAGLPEAGEPLRSTAYGQAQHTARCTHEAERLFALLAPRLQTLALLKGPALAAQAWPEAGLRQFDDLDFLCADRDFPAFAAGMADAGYAPEIGDPRRSAHLWHFGWGAAFRHPDGFAVEVKRRFFPPHYPWPGRCNPGWKSAFADQKLDAAAVRAPTPALHLLLGCLHAVWHGWARMAWIADVAGLLARHPRISSQAQALAACCPFAENALAAGCGVAEAVFGPGLCPAAAPPGVVPQAVALFNGSARAMGGRELRRFHRQFMTKTEVFSYRLRRIATPGDGDFLWISLPPALRGLYWFLRPLRGAIYGKSPY